MKLLLLLLFVAVLGKASAVQRLQYSNRPVLYRMDDDESEEEDNQVQDDVGEDSEEDDPPPAFASLFPVAPGQQKNAPVPHEVFQRIRQEIQEDSWKSNKNRQKHGTFYSRNRADDVNPNPRYRSALRMADESEEDEEEDDIDEPEDDDPFPPAMDRLFPGLPEGSSRPEGSQNSPAPIPQSRPFSARPQGGPQAGPQGRPGPGPSARRLVPVSNGARRFRATAVGNRYPVSYAQQPLSGYGRVPMTYRYAPRQYAQFQPSRPVYAPRQQMPMSGRRQLYQVPMSGNRQLYQVPMSGNRQLYQVPMSGNRQLYQVPVKMSVPVRRYSSPALSSQRVYNGYYSPALSSRRVYNGYSSPALSSQRVYNGNRPSMRYRSPYY